MKQIAVKIDKKGRITATAHGYHGVGCKEALKMIEQLGKVEMREDTYEMLDAPPAGLFLANQTTPNTNNGK
jgi:hypothetical protein